MGKKVAFLDRDGTINVDRGYVHRVEDFQLLEHVTDAIKLFAESGFAVAIVTNQSAINRQLCTPDDVNSLHEHLVRWFADVGVGIDAIAVCPHIPADGCSCRKPRTGLAKIIESQLGQAIDYSLSWVVGDKPTDVEFGENLTAKTALIRSRYWFENRVDCHPVIIADSLWDAAKQIIAGQKNGNTN